MSASVAASEIRDAVRRMFNRVADAPADRYRFAVGAALARAVGYPEAVVVALPPAATETFTGLADLHPYLALRPGEHVLDLGCGAGLDTIVAARTVAPGGRVTGVDVAEAMIDRARGTAALLHVDNAAFERADADATPFPDAAFDVALVNGLFNLCPDKRAVARELFRVLRPGGRAVVAEITFTAPLPATEVRSVDDWFR